MTLIEIPQFLIGVVNATINWLVYKRNLYREIINHNKINGETTTYYYIVTTIM